MKKVKNLVLLVFLSLSSLVAHAEALMFTCDVTGVDLKSFIIDTATHDIHYPQVFSDSLGPAENTAGFQLRKLDHEYLHIERTYQGEKGGKSGTVRERVYVLRYASRVGNKKTLRAKSMISVDQEHVATYTGTCDVVGKAF